jgi:predicted Fe-Mo cluster-binding NifX family protein
MKVAITVWESRVSPVFDSAHRLLIAEIEQGEIIETRFMRIEPEVTMGFVKDLKERGVELLVCGAISQTPATMIENTGITLIPFVAGNVDEVLGCCAKEIDLLPSYAMPGCGNRRQGCRRRRGRCPNGNDKQ